MYFTYIENIFCNCKFLDIFEFWGTLFFKIVISNFCNLDINKMASQQNTVIFVKFPLFLAIYRLDSQKGDFVVFW